MHVKDVHRSKFVINYYLAQVLSIIRELHIFK